MRFSISTITLTFIASGGLIMPSLATAQTTASLSGLYACEAITDKDDQLACFLTETAKLRALTNRPEAPVMEKRSVNSAPNYSAPTTSTETVAIVPKEAMPAPQVETQKEKKKKAKTPDKQILVIKSAARYGSKRYVEFTMDNGEVWRQTQPGRVVLEKGQTNTLSVKKASFGSYLARVNDTGSGFRVRKVK